MILYPTLHKYKMLVAPSIIKSLKSLSNILTVLYTYYTRISISITIALSVVLAVLLPLKLSAEQPQSIVLYDSSEAYNLRSGDYYAEVLLDKEGDLTIDQVASLSIQKRFKALSELENIYEAQTQVYWVKMLLRNPNLQKQRFFISLAGTDRGSLYKEIEQGFAFIGENGLSLPRNRGGDFLGRTPLIDFVLDSQEESLFYLRIAFENPIAIQNKGTINPIERLEIKYYYHTLWTKQMKHWLEGMFIGMLIIMGLYNIFLFFGIKGNSYSYLYFVFFIFTSVFYTLVDEGYAQEFIWRNSPDTARLWVFALPSLVWLFYLLFISRFLALRKSNPMGHKIIMGFVLLELIGFLLTFFHVRYIGIDLSLVFISILVVVYLSIVAIRNGHKTAFYLIIANAFYLLAMVIYIFSVFYGYDSAIYLVNIGEVLQALLFSIGLAARINEMKNEILKKEREQEEIQRKAIENQKAELEKEVQLRTAEITAINAELEGQQDEILKQRDFIIEKNQELEAKQHALIEKQDDLEKAYQNIMILSEIGREITSSLTLNKIIQTVFEHINDMMEATVFGIGVYNAESETLDFIDFILDGNEQTDLQFSIHEENFLSAWCFKNDQPIFINDFDTEYYRYIPKRTRGHLVEDRNSIIYLPLHSKNKIIGVMTVQSRHKNAYSQSQYNILETLAAYIAIAIDNSEAYDQIQEARKEIEHKNIQITDSLRYAQDIQEIVLPANTNLKQAFAEHFVIFRPKDFVSGDFYWLSQDPTEKRTFFAVVDCTGHGVPGAFMSLIGYNLLNQILQAQDYEFKLDELLERLNTGVRHILRQDVEENDDGMDLAIIATEEDKENPNYYNVYFAGAKRPMQYLKDGQLVEIKGTRRSIGGRIRRRQKEFVQHHIKLKKSQTIYLQTDGIADQDGPKGKIGSPLVQQWIEKVHALPLSQQKNEIEKELDAHQQKHEQRDDITLVGIKL
ncbi:MAG: SpoIIE family protein phosphatase [Bernardetiaceae bacterium]|nr:SpoIIE family protein phosphatase [Bernardetiaceae bacterium]